MGLVLVCYFLVVFANYGLHVFRAAVAQFQVVFIEKFVELVILREMFVDEF